MNENTTLVVRDAQHTLNNARVAYTNAQRTVTASLINHAKEVLGFTGKGDDAVMVVRNKRGERFVVTGAAPFFNDIDLYGPLVKKDGELGQTVRSARLSEVTLASFGEE